MLSTGIVVPTDLSDNALPAARAAAWLCRELAVNATLMYSIEPESMYGVVESADGKTKSLVAHAEERLEAIDKEIFDGVGTELRIVEGAREASAAICEVVEEMGAKLVVMGTHGRTAFEHAAFGSTATTVVRHAPCDVLTVRPPLEGKVGIDDKLADWVLSLGQAAAIERILCPIDFSAGSDHALERAAGLAKQFKAKLTLLHNVKYPFWASREEYTLAAEKSRATARKHLESAVKRTAATGIEVASEIADGQPASVIRRFAEEGEGADLIVMGTHGRTGIKRWAIGSVAERIVRASRVPVWTVRLKA